MKNILEIFAKNLGRYFDQSGLIQSDFAERAGISTRYFQDLLGGKAWPSPEKIAGLAKAAKCSEGDLFAGSLIKPVLKPSFSAAAALLSAFETAPRHVQADVLDLLDLNENPVFRFLDDQSHARPTTKVSSDDSL